MARTRNIKPGFFKNEILAEIEPLGRILFEGLWCWADREGRLEDRPARIKAEILPYDNCDIEELLNALVEKGFILRYEVNGNRYIQIITFLKHQNPHKKETPSSIPAPDNFEESTGISGTSMGNSEISKENSETSRARSLNLDPRSLKLQQQDRNSNLESNSEQQSNKEKDLAAVVDVFDNNLHPVTPLELEEIQDWLKDLPAGVIILAIKEAVAQNARRWAYIRAILNNWLQEGLVTVEAVEAYKREQQSKSTRSRDDPEDATEKTLEAYSRMG